LFSLSLMNRSIIVGAIIISAAILVSAFLERHAHVASTVSKEATTTVPAGDQTIAVPPFTTLGPGDADSSLADGLQREIITRLTAEQVKAASVREAPSAGKLLLGSVQHAGNQVRINVQLVDAASRIPLWAETYDRQLTDVFALESEIAESVAKAVAAKQKS
jgi:TolB-like protein